MKRDFIDATSSKNGFATRQGRRHSRPKRIDFLLRILKRLGAFFDRSRAALSNEFAAEEARNENGDLVF